jgi:phosphate starvation-inducible protein PhoH and related proteins
MGKSKKKKDTKQTLEYVETEKKFHVPTIKCRSAKQKEFLRVLESHEVTICTGPAGTSKTYTAVYNALKALEKKQVD